VDTSPPPHVGIFISRNACDPNGISTQSPRLPRDNLGSNVVKFKTTPKALCPS